LVFQDKDNPGWLRMDEAQFTSSKDWAQLCGGVKGFLLGMVAGGITVIVLIVMALGSL